MSCEDCEREQCWGGSICQVITLELLVKSLEKTTTKEPDYIFTGKIPNGK